MSDGKSDAPLAPQRLGPQRSARSLAPQRLGPQRKMRKGSSATSSPALMSEKGNAPGIESLRLNSSAPPSNSTTPAASPPTSSPLTSTLSVNAKDLPKLGATVEVKEKKTTEEEKKGETTKEGEETKAEGGEDKEVTDGDASSKHPLQYSWTMSFFLPSQTKQDIKTFQSNITEACTFKTVEDFWRFFNNLRDIDRLPMRSDYYLFKTGIIPAWEHDANAHGGKWVVEFNRQDREAINRAWMNTTLACIGESFGAESEDLCGIVVSVRNKKFRISLWTKTASNSVLQKRIGVQLKKYMDVSNCPEMNYQPHHDANGTYKTTSYTKSSLTI